MIKQQLHVICPETG